MNERGKSRVGLAGRSDPEIRNQQVGGSSPLAGSKFTNETSVIDPAQSKCVSSSNTRLTPAEWSYDTSCST